MVTQLEERLYLNSLTDAERVKKCSKANFAICSHCEQPLLSGNYSLDREVGNHLRKCREGKVTFYRYTLPS